MANEPILDDAAFNTELDEIMSSLQAPPEEVSNEPDAPPELADEHEADDAEDPAVSHYKAMSVEDQAKAFDAMQRKLDALGGYVAQQYQQPRQQPQQQQQQPQYQPAPQPQQQQPQEPFLLTNQDVAPIYEQLQHVQRIQAQNMWNQEAATYKQAEANLRAKFKDFDEIVPEQERVRAFDQLARQGAYGQNWQARFEHVYKAFAFDKVAARADELQQKRDAKRVAATRAAGAVPPSGAVFQLPEVKLDRSKRGYSDARNATSEALKALL